MAGQTRQWIPLLTDAKRALAGALSEAGGDGHALGTAHPVHQRAGPGARSASATDLVAVGLIACWLVHRAVFEADGDLREAEEWLFDGSPDARATSGWIESSQLDPTIHSLCDLPRGDVLEELLPYLLESLEPHEADRAGRRNTGTAYTPGDVADLMARAALRRNDVRDPHALDPACGTGVLLRALLSNLAATPAEVETRAALLNGIDISPTAIQSASFVLLARCLRLSGNTSRPWRLWRDVLSRLHCEDATVLTPPDVESQCILPEWASDVSKPFDIVIANPPYNRFAADGMGPDRCRIYRSLPPGVDAPLAFTPFVEMLWRFGAPDSSGAIVVPLSLAYGQNKQLRSLREAMVAAGGHWDCYFFDRSPDSLFGDDVKTRNAILISSQTHTAAFKLCTSSLARWSSSTRPKFLDRLKSVPLHGSILDGIPKLGSPTEVNGYSVLRRRRTLRAARGVQDSVNHRSSIYYRNTAYNWLPFARYQHALDDAVEQPAHRLTFATEAESWVALAILSSRLTYWWWRVAGDGFHLTERFIRSVPFAMEELTAKEHETLDDLGRTLWESMKRHPVTAVNRGVSTVSFDPTGDGDTLSRIDTTLCRIAGIQDFAPFLESFTRNTIDAGREAGNGSG